MKLSGNMKRRRSAISDLFGSLLMIAITLIAGVAAFGWINGQAATSEKAYGNSVGNNINLLNERFTVVTQTFYAGGGGACTAGISPNFQCDGASFWIFNNGQAGFNLSTIQVRNLTDIPSTAANPNPVNIIFYTASNTGCPVGTQTCGFAAFNKAGTSLTCSNTQALPTINGFYQNNGLNDIPPPLLLQNQLSNNPYQIAMPTAATCSAGPMYIYDGITYTFTFNGLYGNSVPVTVTVSG
jgi:flagellin-like protein